MSLVPGSHIVVCRSVVSFSSCVGPRSTQTNKTQSTARSLACRHQRKSQIAIVDFLYKRGARAVNHSSEAVTIKEAREKKEDWTLAV